MGHGFINNNQQHQKLLWEFPSNPTHLLDPFGFNETNITGGLIGLIWFESCFIVFVCLVHKRFEYIHESCWKCWGKHQIWMSQIQTWKEIAHVDEY